MTFWQDNHTTFKEARAAVSELSRLYMSQVKGLVDSWQQAIDGRFPHSRVSKHYPRVLIETHTDREDLDPSQSYGLLPHKGIYTSTFSRPDVFAEYLEQMLNVVLEKNPGVEIQVGLSDVPIPLNYAINDQIDIAGQMDGSQVNKQRIRDSFDLYNRHHHRNPDIQAKTGDGRRIFPLSWHMGPYIDRTADMLRHYTGTTMPVFQKNVLLTNYDDYMQLFQELALDEMKNNYSNEDDDPYLALVKPGGEIIFNPNVEDAKERFAKATGERPLNQAKQKLLDLHDKMRQDTQMQCVNLGTLRDETFNIRGLSETELRQNLDSIRADYNLLSSVFYTRKPQMPAYHLVRSSGLGLTMVNIGVGPANAHNISRHITVTRPHSIIMVGHCALLSATQKIGHFVMGNSYKFWPGLAESYQEVDDSPQEISEMHVAIMSAAKDFLGGEDTRRNSFRTGRVLTTNNRFWELPETEEEEARLERMTNNCIAVDMESGIIAAVAEKKGIRFASILCGSDRPLNNEPKNATIAQDFYQSSKEVHLRIALRAIENLNREKDPFKSRKLRLNVGPVFA